MAKLRTLVPKIRSKNAGPFWLTIDVFCEADDVFETVRTGVTTAAIGAVFDQPEQEIKRFDLADLRVIKFSLPRPAIQGSIRDRDMHGSSWAALIGEIEI